MELLELYGLMDRFAASGLTALEWEKDGERVSLRREGAASPVQAAPAPLPAAHEVPAPADCVVEEVLAQDGEAVGVGAPLFRIRRV